MGFSGTLYSSRPLRKSQRRSFNLGFPFPLVYLLKHNSLMKWAPVQVCVYLVKLMRRRCSVISLSSGIYSQAEFSHCGQKKTACPLTGTHSDRAGKFRSLSASSQLLSNYCTVRLNLGMLLIRKAV